jgi:Alpha-glutamyl/putrescinyl thymine pyrophosphorylase clade 3
MRPKDAALGRKLEKKLCSFGLSLQGIQMPATRAVFIEQIVESIRRIRYLAAIREKKLSNLCMDPSKDCFDPLKASILSLRQGKIDEAFWLVLLSVHFGKHRHAGWRLARNVYGCLRTEKHWDWERTSSDSTGFRDWLGANEAALKQDGVGFGNHRKYESLSSVSARGTGAVVESYLKWVGPMRTHQGLIEVAQIRVGTDPKLVFDDLYRSMDAVISFGRTAKFDYLTMIGKIGLAAVEPGTPYLQGSTGPLKGARLLFGGTAEANLNAKDLDSRLVHLGAELNVGMQVLEDALCNWQKSPGRFVAFRG